MWWHYLIGYGFSITGSYFMIGKLLMKAQWKNLGQTGNEKEDGFLPRKELPSMVGNIECVLYTSSWLLGRPEFIAIWLVLKVAGGMKSWTEEVTLGKIKFVGRNIFNVFLIGNALSISFGVVGAKIIQWLNKESYTLAIIVPVLLVIGVLVLWGYTKYLWKKSYKELYSKTIA